MKVSHVIMFDDIGGDHNDDWRRRSKYLYSGRAVTYDELRAEVEIEAAGLDPEQWLEGEFVFDAWLSDSLNVGTVERVDDEEDRSTPMAFSERRLRAELAADLGWYPADLDAESIARHRADGAHKKTDRDPGEEVGTPDRASAPA